jgi:tetratricopeptide (TPR) repeat protein
MKSAVVLCALTLLASGSPGEASSTPRAMTLEARRLMESGDTAGALALMVSAREALVAAGPPDRELGDALAGQLHNAGVRLNNGGDAAGAMRAFGEVLRLDASLKGVRDEAFRRRVRDTVLQLGRFLAASGSPDAALDSCRLLAARVPADGEALAVLGMVLLAKRDFQAAAEEFEASAGASPDLADAAGGAGQAWLGLAGERAGAGDYSEAARLAELSVRWAQRAVELEPRQAARHAALGAGLIRQAALRERLGDLAGSSQSRVEAGAALRKAVDLDPESPATRMELALFLFSEEDHARAEKEFAGVMQRLEALLAAQPDAREAPSWRGALDAARENRAAAWHNLAVEELNRARFDEAGRMLSRVCAAGARWQPACRSLTATLEQRRESFTRAVAHHEADLARHPDRASALLALGDLHAQVGHYEAARRSYERLRASGEIVPGLADRLAAVTDPGPLPEISRVVTVPGGRVRLTFYAASLEADLTTASKAAWLRVQTALGEPSLGGDVSVVVFPTRRAFRERAGARVGGLVKGYYQRGRISLFQTPSHTTVEWVSALTHEIAHHAVERTSGGRAPRWLSEGIARWVEGESAVLDWSRLKERADSGDLPRLRDLDDVLLRSWNDPDLFLDGRDVALRAVQELARLRGGGAGLLAALRNLAASREEGPAAVESALGITLAELDASWRKTGPASPQ